MSIQTDLTRLQSAKSAIKAAIEGKGVTVPEATLLDGMAALIEAIEAGGGGGVKFANGTITPTENSKSTVITHNLGAIPDYFFLRDTGSDNTNSPSARVNKRIWMVYAGKDSGNAVVEQGTANSYSRFYYKNAIITTDTPSRWDNSCSHTATENTLVVGNTYNSFLLGSGRTYEWIAILGVTA